MQASLNGVQYGSNFRIRGRLQIYNIGRIVVGDNVVINSASWTNPIGGGGCSQLQIFPMGN